MTAYRLTGGQEESTIAVEIFVGDGKPQPIYSIDHSSDPLLVGNLFRYLGAAEQVCIQSGQTFPGRADYWNRLMSELNLTCEAIAVEDMGMREAQQTGFLQLKELQKFRHEIANSGPGDWFPDVG